MYQLHLAAHFLIFIYQTHVVHMYILCFHNHNQRIILSSSSITLNFHKICGFCSSFSKLHQKHIWKSSEIVIRWPGPQCTVWLRENPCWIMKKWASADPRTQTVGREAPSSLHWKVLVRLLSTGKESVYLQWRKFVIPVHLIKDIPLL